MIRFFKNLFKGKDPGPAPEAPYKVEPPVVEAVNKVPLAEKPNVVAKVATQAKKKAAPKKPAAEKKPAAIKAPKKPAAKKAAK